jgi:ABC-type molybdenum transport system ATPase subunit/photorepair protein PhrA
MNTYAEPSDRSGRVDKLTRALERGESGSAAVCGAPQSEGGRNVDRLQHVRLVSSGLGQLARRATVACSMVLSLAAASPAAYSQEQAATGAESTERSLQTITVTGG